MSKIGKRPIDLPKEVKLDIKGSSVSIKGPKGEFNYALPEGISLKQQDQTILVERRRNTPCDRAFHGLARALVNNMVEGVTKGFKKDLEIIGVGYKVQLKGASLVLQIGFSHLVEISVWKDLKVTCTGPTKIAIEGIDKQRVGEFAAKIRNIRPPEPYKGKGIRYAGEQVRKKLGKAMAKA